MSIQRLFALFFFAISTLFMAVAVVSIAITVFFLLNSTVVNGTVSGYREIVNYAPFGLFTADESKRFFVEAEYGLSDTRGGQSGVRYAITAERGSSEAQYEIGEAISIRYHNRVPSRARINTRIGLHGGALVFLLLSMTFGLLGMIVRFAFRLGSDREP